MVGQPDGDGGGSGGGRADDSFPRNYVSRMASGLRNRWVEYDELMAVGWLAWREGRNIKRVMWHYAHSPLVCLGLGPTRWRGVERVRRVDCEEPDPGTGGGRGRELSWGMVDGWARDAVDEILLRLVIEGWTREEMRKNPVIRSLGLKVPELEERFNYFSRCYERDYLT